MDIPSLTSEQKLILFLIKSCFKRGEINREFHYSEFDFDYGKLNFELFRHGLIGFFYQSLDRRVKIRLSDRFFENLKRYNLFHTTSCLLKIFYLDRIRKLFVDSSKDFALLKGPAISMQAFGSEYVRNFIDLDILIPKNDLKDVISLLISTGYKTIPAKVASNIADFSKYENEVSLVHSGGWPPIDLHWDNSRHYISYYLDWQYYESRFVNIEISDTKVLTLSPEANVLYLSIHGAKHGWGRLEWLCTLGSLVERNKIDWAVVLQEAESLHSRRILSLACLLLIDVCGIELPEFIVKVIEHDKRRIKSVAEIIRSQLFETNDGRKHIEKRYSKCHFLLRDNLVEFLKYALRLVFIPTGEDWVRAPAERSFWRLGLGRPFRIINMLTTKEN